MTRMQQTGDLPDEVNEVTDSVERLNGYAKAINRILERETELPDEHHAAIEAIIDDAAKCERKVREYCEQHRTVANSPIARGALAAKPFVEQFAPAIAMYLVVHPHGTSMVVLLLALAAALFVYQPGPFKTVVVAWATIDKAKHKLEKLRDEMNAHTRTLIDFMAVARGIREARKFDAKFALEATADDQSVAEAWKQGAVQFWCVACIINVSQTGEEYDC